MQSTKLETFKSLFTERLTATAVELFAQVDSIVEHYCQENRRLKETLHAVLNPDIKLCRIDQDLTASSTPVLEERASVDQVHPHIKEEPETHEISPRDATTPIILKVEGTAATFIVQQPKVEDDSGTTSILVKVEDEAAIISDPPKVEDGDFFHGLKVESKNDESMSTVSDVGMAYDSDFAENADGHPQRPAANENQARKKCSQCKECGQSLKRKRINTKEEDGEWTPDKLGTASNHRATPEYKKKSADYEAKRKRRFLPEWKDTYPFIDYDQTAQLMYCKTCRSCPAEAVGCNMFHGVTGDKVRVRNIQYHVLTTAHKASEAALKARADPQGGGAPQGAALLSVSDQMDPAIKEKMVRLFNIAYFIAKGEAPFAMFPKLVAQHQTKGLDLGSTYSNDQACRGFIKTIGSCFFEELQQSLKSARFFSVMSDSSADRSVKDQELIYCTYLHNGKPVTQLIQIVALDHPHSQGILDAILSGLLKVGIGEGDLKKRMVGFGCDGASAMLSVNDGVTARFQRLCPSLVPIWCVAHRLERFALDSVKQLPQLEDIKHMLGALHKHYTCSTKAPPELKEISKQMEFSSVRPGTHWPPYMSHALEALMRHYRPVLIHFEKYASDPNDKEASATMKAGAKLVLQTLKQYKMLLFVHLMLDVLKELKQLCLLFQRDGLTLQMLSDGLQTTTLSLVAIQGGKLEQRKKKKARKPVQKTILQLPRTKVKPPVVHHDKTFFSRLVEAFKDIPDDQKPLIATLGLKDDVQLVDSAIGKVPLGCPLSYHHPLPSSRDYTPHDDAPYPPSLPLASHKLGPPVSLPVLSDKSQEHMKSLETTWDGAHNLELSTRGLTGSVEELRKFRVTSRFFEICHLKGGKTLAKHLAAKIQKGARESSELRRDEEQRPEALREYCRQMFVNWSPCGLVVHPNAPWLAAIPDGMIYDPTEIPSYGLVYIKCPKVRSFVECKFLDLQYGILELKNNHAHYYHMQGEMMVTGTEWCDLVVYAEDDILVQRIYRNKSIFKIMKQKLDNFFFHHYLPSLNSV